MEEELQVTQQTNQVTTTTLAFVYNKCCEKMSCKKKFLLVTSNVAALCFYLLDVGSDLFNASLYMSFKTHYQEGIATFIFVFLPVLIQVILATISLMAKHYQGTGSRLLAVQWLEAKPKTSSIILHYILMVSLLEPVYSTYEIIRRGWKSSTRKELDDIAYKRKAERIIESIFESIPQAALQFLITGHEPYMSGLQTVSIFTSLLNLCYTLVTLDMERIAQERSSKRKMLKRKWKLYWFFKDHLWCVFGGIPLILSSILSVSLFTPIYTYYALSFYVVVVALFITRWWWWKPETRQRWFFHVGYQTIISIVSLCTKLFFAMLIILWYIRVKMHQESILQVRVPLGVPPFVWPDTYPFLLQLATSKGNSTPPWANCSRFIMSRNGTFAVDIRRWLSGSSWYESANDFLLSSKLLCLSDMANTLFCVVFYCLVTWLVWDVMRYIYRMSSPPQHKQQEKQQNYAIQYKLSPALTTDLFGDSFKMLQSTANPEDSHNLIGLVRV